MSSKSNDVAPIRSGEEIPLRELESYLRVSLPEDALPEPDRSTGPLTVEQFPGGHSNLTYCIRIGAREFVLRRPPLGPVAPKAHDMPREFRVLSLVHPVFPLAPRPYLLCTDSRILGAPFYVMERRRGVVIRRELPAKFSDDIQLRTRISETVIDTLAELHAVDIYSSGIHEIGKPDGFLERQIRGWAGRWERAQTESVPEVGELMKWLSENVPRRTDFSLVHNDYKLDNLLLHPEDPRRVRAVLDWEMSTVGDPLVDLGLLLCYWPESGDPEDRRESISAVTTLPGWFSRDQLVERYAEKTKRDLSDVQFYEAFALFKVAVIVQQIYFRYHRGQTRDPRFAEFGRRARGLMRSAAELLR